jgi:large subunit ribosomal protein L29
MKMNELKELSNEELAQKLQDFQEELFNLRFQKAKNLLDNPFRIRKIKKDIARVKTLMTQREARG